MVGLRVVGLTRDARSVMVHTALPCQFDSWCAEKADAVRCVGGLLTIATSLQDTPRLERQLRGRAGRQVCRALVVLEGVACHCCVIGRSTVVVCITAMVAQGDPGTTLALFDLQDQMVALSSGPTMVALTHLLDGVPERDRGLMDPSVGFAVKRLQEEQARWWREARLRSLETDRVRACVDR